MAAQVHHEIKIKRGRILVYRVYDIGSEIDLEKVETLFEDKTLRERFKLDRKHNMSLIISRSPVSIQLGNIEINVNGKKCEAELVAKVWHFGTVSLCFQIPIEEGTNWGDLVKIASWLENDDKIDLAARIKAREFQNDIKIAIPAPNEWTSNEDYVTYFIQEFDGLEGPLSQLTEKVDVPALILAESKEVLSESMKKSTLENMFQYSKDDLVVVDWNSALVVEPSGSMDVPLVIEFALNQLLEMRYYDDLLDQRLNTLYNEVVGRKRGIFSNKYSRLAEDAGQIYLEISEIGMGVAHGWKPASQPLRVTESVGERLISLNSMQAVEAFEEHAKRMGKEFNTNNPLPFFLHNVIGIESGEGNYRLRVDSEFEAERSKDIADWEAQGLEAEALELEKALDFAFEQLTGEKLTDGEMEFSVDGEIKDLDLSIDLAITKGKDLGVDLGFLGDNSEETPDSESELN